ncbi:MAG TPA: MATE family efflux transporter [Candidatus Mediterraneibacter cottocaccae]|nr:MATE family efflux transporter [Candidatus Mediterraneibacter cottocaccae]
MTKTLTKGKPFLLILEFSLPLIAGNIFQQFYSMADTLIVGRTISVNALAAVGCTGSITFLILGFVNGLTSGLSIITAQRFGSGDSEGVRRSFAVSIVLSFAAAALMTAVSIPLSMPFLKLLETPAEIITDADIYLKVIFIGIPAQVLFNLLSNEIRALGDSRTPLYFLIFACIVNIILDFALILIFHMGVAGAGVATVFSQLLSGVMCIIYIHRKFPLLCVRREDFRMDLRNIRIHLSTGLPMAFQMSIIAVGSLILQSALNRLGAVSVAAYTAAQKIDSIATMPMNSFGMAMATYAAQNYGAGKLDRVRQGVNQCILLSGGFSIVMGVVNIMVGRQLTALFVSAGETEVIELSHTYLTITGSTYVILALLFIYRFTLQGLGKSLVPTVAGVMELVMRAFSGLILADLFGFPGACLSNPLAWAGACVPLTAAYYWTMRGLRKETAEPENRRNVFFLRGRRHGNPC